MISTWRRRMAAWRAAKEENDIGGFELTIPNHFKCPISLDLMKDPVTLSTGITYDRDSIEKWMETGHTTCPITNQVLASVDPIPNHTIRKMIQNWCVENRSHGIERIPTPRIPVSSGEVVEMISRIESASEKNDRVGSVNLVSKVKNLVKESERNKRCVVSNGTDVVLSSAFEAFSSFNNLDENVVVLDEILSALNVLSPISDQALILLGSSNQSMKMIVKLLNSEDLCRRRNAVLVLKEIVAYDARKFMMVSEPDNQTESALFKLVKEPICPGSMRAALMIMNEMVTTNAEAVSRLVEMGIVRLLLETMVDSEKGICERSLAVLDGICGYEIGREKAYENALTMPVVVKKMLRVSNLATEFSVSILWKLCKNEKSEEEEEEEEAAVVEALRVGAFQKVLLLLQVGCREKTKEKATELLKVLNVNRGRVECIDSMDFKYLNRPF